MAEQLVGGAGHVRVSHALCSMVSGTSWLSSFHLGEPSTPPCGVQLLWNKVNAAWARELEGQESLALEFPGDDGRSPVGQPGHGGIQSRGPWPSSPEHQEVHASGGPEGAWLHIQRAWLQSQGPLCPPPCPYQVM